MSWFKVTLSPAQIADGSDLQLLEKFEEAIMRFGAPEDSALFCKGNEYFFSPRAAALAPKFLEAHRATKCDPPKFAEVTLLAGNCGPWEFSSRLRNKTRANSA